MFDSLPSALVYVTGFAAQIFFASRTLFQWLASEKAKKVVSPSAYWVLSVLGSYLMFIYGVMRDDFAIILGQLISYYIYLWNLNSKGVWQKLGLVLQIILIGTPVAAIVLLLHDAQTYVQSFFRNDSIPLWLVIFGSAGQIIFTLRFIYQWIYSKIKGESSLPTGFWVISLVGSSVIVAYGIIRKDPVLILGQSFGFVAYVRNLMIGFRKNKKKENDSK